MPFPGGQQLCGWVQGVVGRKVAAGAVLRAEKCSGMSGVYLLRLLLVSLTSSLSPPAHASFSTSALSFVF